MAGPTREAGAARGLGGPGRCQTPLRTWEENQMSAWKGIVCLRCPPSLLAFVVFKAAALQRLWYWKESKSSWDVDQWSQTLKCIPSSAVPAETHILIPQVGGGAGGGALKSLHF